MPMFSKLFEILLNAKHLLSLEPAELAGHLLISLGDIKQINPESLITYKNMTEEIKKSSPRNPQLIYPKVYDEDVLLALMEAWQSLLSEGFVAPRPTDLPSDTYRTSAMTYFITRRGKKIETLEDYEAYRKANLLRKHQLHPIIAEKVWFIFAQGSYGTAVLEAFKQVEVAVREAGGYTKDIYGDTLMRKAFHHETGNLTDENQSESERKGKSHLFAGAIGLYRNPSGHHEVEFAPEAAAEIIIIASHLLRIVDSCAERISNPPN